MPRNEDKSVFGEGQNEEESLHRRTDRRGPQRIGGWRYKRRNLPQAWNIQQHAVQRRAKYGGMQVADVKRLKQLEEENMQLKKLLGEQTLLIDGYKNALTKKY